MSDSFKNSSFQLECSTFRSVGVDICPGACSSIHDRHHHRQGRGDDQEDTAGVGCTDPVPTGRRTGRAEQNV